MSGTIFSVSVFCSVISRVHKRVNHECNDQTQREQATNVFHDYSTLRRCQSGELRVFFLAGWPREISIHICDTFGKFYESKRERERETAPERTSKLWEKSFFYLPSLIVTNRCLDYLPFGIEIALVVAARSLRNRSATSFQVPFKCSRVNNKIGERYSGGGNGKLSDGKSLFPSANIGDWQVVKYNVNLRARARAPRYFDNCEMSEIKRGTNSSTCSAFILLAQFRLNYQNAIMECANK